MKIVMKNLSIEDDGTEIIHIDNFSMTLKPNALNSFGSGLSDVLGVAVNKAYKEEQKEI